MKVEINIEKPLPEGFDLARPNRELKKILIKNEKLSEFCCACRCLGHLAQACPLFSVVPEISQYGPWMRAENTTFGKRNEDQIPRRTPLPPIRIREPLTSPPLDKISTIGLCVY